VKSRADHPAGVGIGAVAGDHPGRLHGEDAVRRLDGQHGVVRLLLDGDELVLPAQVCQRLAGEGGDQRSSR
jgi:hypothetical protein